jgi:SAM-dependent methyltransferase
VQLKEAIEFIRPAVPADSMVWAEFGAGRGMFTQALAAILDKDATVFAIDRDPGAVRALRVLPKPVIAVTGDFRDLDAIEQLRGVRLDGALFANALHFVGDADIVLSHALDFVRPGGRIVVIEYDSDRPNRWVPHPIPAERLTAIARSAGLTTPEIVARRASAYHGAMYCAIATRLTTVP